MINSMCPNESSKAWKELLEALNGDEVAAYRTWRGSKDKNGENYIPSVEELIKGGVIKPKDSPVRFQAAVDNLHDRKHFLHKKLTTLKGESRMLRKKLGTDTSDKVKATTNAQLKDTNQQIQRLERIITSIEDRMVELQDKDAYNSLESIYNHANEELKYVENLLNTNDILSFQDIEHALRITKLWERVGRLDDGNPFFTEQDMKAFSDDKNEVFKKIAREYKAIQAKAELLQERLFNIRKDSLQDSIYNTFGEDAEVDFDKAVEDISKLASLELGLGNIDNTVTRAMFVWNKVAHDAAHKEAREIFEGIEKVMDAIHKRFSNKQLMDLFIQEQGNLTFRYSQKWFDERWMDSKDYRLKVEALDGDNRKKLIKENITKYQKKTIMFDARKLFPRAEDKFSKEEIEEHKKNLIAALGQKGFNFYYERMQEKINEYNAAKEAEETNLAEMYSEDMATQAQLKNRWEIENSPYRAAEAFYDKSFFKAHDPNGNQYFATSNKFTEIIPKRTIDGVDTGYYDKKYETIENDKDLSALYDYLIGTLHTLNAFLPEEERKKLQANSLPYIEKGVMDHFMEGNIGKSFAAMQKHWTEATTTGMGGKYEPSSRRDIEGNIIREVGFRGFKDHQTIIKEYVERRKIEHFQEIGKEPEAFKLLEWRREIEQELKEQRNYDFETMLKLYALAVMQYKHKSKVEDVMTAAYSIMRKTAEQQLTNAGEPIKDNFNNPVSKVGLANLISMLDFFMKGFYGEPTTLQEMAFGNKVFTVEEKKMKVDIENLLEKNKQQLEKDEIDLKDYMKVKETLEAQLVKIGGKRTVSAIGDQINMWIRLRGLGWNLFAPLMNMNVGFFTNITEASGEEKFNQDQLMKGYYYALIKDRKKVSAIMRRNDTLSEVQNEAYETQKTARGYKKWLQPFQTTSSAEYVNQSPVMVAILLNTKVKVNGKEISLYDAYDENGMLSNDIEYISTIPVISTLGEVGVKIHIDDTIARIHGNYDPRNQIKANESILGRSLHVFRKWMIMSYYNRLGTQIGKVNPLTGIKDKGRWWSYGNYFKEYGAFGGVFQVTLNLLRKFTFGAYKTDFSKLDSVDAANMRRNLTEIVFIIATTALALFLKTLVKMGDDDEEESTFKFIAYFYINQLGRLERDIMFYIDPQQFKSVLKDPLPVMGLVGDCYDVVTRAINLLTGGEDEYQSGYRKGNSKTWTSVKKITPGASNMDRLYSLTSQVIDN